MTVKQLVFREEARDKIRRGVDALADAVKVTLGPRGRTVILDRDFGPPRSFMWGARGQVRGAGGGLEMAQRGLRCLTGGVNPMDLRRGMEEAIAVVVVELPRLARPPAPAHENFPMWPRSRPTTNLPSMGSGLRPPARQGCHRDRVEGPHSWGEAVLRGGRVALQPARRAGAQPRGRKLARDSGNRLIALAVAPGPQPGCGA
jgi:hypothetical protein